MEIGAANVPSCKTTEPLVAMVDSLATTVEKLATKLAKIEARHNPRPPPTTYEAPSMSVKRACDWSVTTPRRAVRVSEARMGLVNGRDGLPSRSRNSCSALQ